MRLTKSLLFAISALALATGAAFAGGDSMSSQSYEAESFAEADVIYIYPLEVTEMIVLVPSVDSETPMGG